MKGGQKESAEGREGEKEERWGTGQRDGGMMNKEKRGEGVEKKKSEYVQTEI